MKLTLSFDSSVNASILQQAVAAAGANTTINIGSAQAVNISTLLAAINAAGNTKNFGATFAGDQLTSNNLQQALSAAGTNTTISVNTAQAVNITTLLSLISSAGNTKKFNAEFNGAQLTSNNLQQAVSASGTNTKISVNTAQAVNITTLLGVISAAGNTKQFSADFNGAALTANNLQQAISAAGTNVSISINTAQSVNITTLLDAFSIAGATKKLSAGRPRNLSATPDLSGTVLSLCPITNSVLPNASPFNLVKPKTSACGGLPA